MLSSKQSAYKSLGICLDGVVAVIEVQVVIVVVVVVVVVVAVVVVVVLLLPPPPPQSLLSSPISPPFPILNPQRPV